MAGLTASFFGVTALQGFAIGGLAFNTAAIILPVFGAEVEDMIEIK